MRSLLFGHLAPHAAIDDGLGEVLHDHDLGQVGRQGSHEVPHACVAWCWLRPWYDSRADSDSDGVPVMMFQDDPDRDNTLPDHGAHLWAVVLDWLQVETLSSIHRVLCYLLPSVVDLWTK